MLDMYGAALPGQEKPAMAGWLVFRSFAIWSRACAFSSGRTRTLSRSSRSKSEGYMTFAIPIQKFGERGAEAGEQFLQDVDGRLVFAPLNLVDIIFGHIGFFGKTVYAEPSVSP